MPLVFESFRAAREGLAAALREAGADGLVVVSRADGAAALVNASSLRHFLASVVPSGAVIAPDEHGYSVYLPEQPIAADGATLDDALSQMVEALRTYAAAWHEVLRQAPNHSGNWGLVQLIELSSDDQLRDWLAGSSA